MAAVRSPAPAISLCGLQTLVATTGVGRGGGVEGHQHLSTRAKQPSLCTPVQPLLRSGILSPSPRLTSRSVCSVEPPSTVHPRQEEVNLIFTQQVLLATPPQRTKATQQSVTHTC